MAQANVFEQGIDRFQSTIKDFDREVQRARREIGKRRRGIEKELKSRRQTLERRAEKQIRKLRSELRRYPAFKRAEAIQSDTRKRVEEGIGQIVDLIPVASRNEVETLERKIARLSRRVRELEKSNGVAESA
jgi:predicted translin family RNA/ssDNA-binding protein